MIKRETIVAGKIISRRYYGAAERIPGEKRKKKSNPTAENVAAINRRNSERELTLKLHHNFTHGDIHVVLTYAQEPPTPEAAKKELDNFLRRLRNYFRKKEMLLKWILVTEYTNERIHHHMILSRMDTADLDNLWRAGHARPTHLDASGDYRKLASYLIKETDKTFRKPDAFSRQRFSCSRTVAAPPKKVEEVRASEMLRTPKPVKGYYIDQDSIYRGTNPVTGVPYLEYIMISMEEKPRLRIWPRGKKYKYKEKYYDSLHREITEFQVEFVLPEIRQKGGS
jgi:hypothetical protein